MQEWLKDKKNLPIIVALGSLILVGSIVAMLFEFGVLGGTPSPVPVAVATAPGSTSPGAPAAPPPGSPAGAPGSLPGAPPVSGPMQPGTPAPNATAKAPGTGTPGAAAPVARTGKTDDPFRVPGFPAPLTSTSLIPVSTLRTQVPFVYIARIAPKVPGGIPPIREQSFVTQVSATQRVSGVLFTDTGIHAVLETNGQSQQVQPGDPVNLGDPVNGGRVISIQADGLTLRREDGTLVRVPLTGTSTGAGASAPAPPSDANAM